MKDTRQHLEDVILGSILVSEGKCLDLVDLEPEDFGNSFYQEIFAACRKLRLDPTRGACDIHTVAVQLGRGASILAGLANVPVSVDMVDHYVRDLKAILLEDMKGRIATEAQLRIGNGEDPSIVATWASEQQDAVTGRYASDRSNKSLEGPVYELLENIAERRAVGRVLYLGIPAIDKMSLGLLPGNNVILAARPSIGKSAMALQFCTNLAAHSIGSALFSLEMSREEIGGRLVAQVTGRGTSGIVRDPSQASESDRDFITRNASAVLEISRHIQVWDDGGMTWRDIKARARQAVKQGAKLLVLDYLQLVSGDGRENRNNELEEVSRGWKGLLRELKVPGIALSQLNRDCEKNQRIPRLSDLRDCGGIEQDADYVWFIHRPNLGDPKTELYQAKARGVGLGMCNLTFRGASQLFYGVENREENQ